MRLVVDIGNTLVKAAVFDREEIVFIDKRGNIDLNLIHRISGLYPRIKSAIFASVRQIPEGMLSGLNNIMPVLQLGEDTPVPLKILYENRSGLGADRMAAAVAAKHLFPETNTLVIGAGTCITYDITNASGHYLGGAISPGMGMRYKALHNFTDKLPLLEAGKEPALTGNSTEASIHSGIINGIGAEIDGMIDKYKQHYENLTIILSGGDLEYFDKKLKNNIFAIPNIVLTGLNIILKFNDQS
jgi:type III pantothenate kinase